MGDEADNNVRPEFSRVQVLKLKSDLIDFFMSKGCGKYSGMLVMRELIADIEEGIRSIRKNCECGKCLPKDS